MSSLEKAIEGCKAFRELAIVIECTDEVENQGNKCRYF